MNNQTYISLTEFTARFGLTRIAQLTGDPRGEDVGQKANDAISEMANHINAALRSVVQDINEVDVTDPYLKDLNGRGAYLVIFRDKPGGWSDDHAQQWADVQKELDKISSGKRSVMLLEGNSFYGGFFQASKKLFGRGVYKK
jgi:phage gp36-like protein